MKSSGHSPAETENLRGLALMLSGDAKKALEAFEVATELDAKLVEARLNRGIALLKLGEHAKASSAFAEIWEHEDWPLRASAAYHQALALDALKRATDAEAWLDRALALDPKLDSARIYLGSLKERRGDLQGAGKAYLDFLKRHPQSPIGNLRFGVSAHRAGRPEVARRYLQTVIESAPDSLEAAEARKFLVMWE